MWLILATAVAGPVAAQPAVMTIRVDGSARGHAISPDIYGTNFATTAQLRDLRAPINRAGGNSASLYNWQEDARNAGADWFFQSLPVSDAETDQFGARFVMNSARGGARSMITISVNGWIATLGEGRAKRAAYSVAKYGPQRSVDTRWYPDAGNGIRLDGTRITDNDPADAARQTGIDEQVQWVKALTARFGMRKQGGVAYYLMDNEPGLWFETHRAVHPVGVHAQDYADTVIATSRAIKAVDPSAQIMAPEEWGWLGLLHSGFDTQHRDQPDMRGKLDRDQQTGGMDYLPWLLQRWKAAGRPVDIISVHLYPQGGEIGEDALSPVMQHKRARSTRALWDRAYVDESWINQPVALIPRLRQWIDRHYWPDTPIAITEYSWGAEDHMSGATAQADILGIFGRERVAVANRWGTPRTGSPAYLAMKIYRNADDRGSAFGDVSLATSTPDPDRLSAFAARKSDDGAITVMVVNKQRDTAQPIRIAIAGAPFSGAIRTITLADGKLGNGQAMTRTGATITGTVPAQSVTLLTIAKR